MFLFFCNCFSSVLLLAAFFQLLQIGSVNFYFFPLGFLFDHVSFWILLNNENPSGEESCSKNNFWLHVVYFDTQSSKLPFIFEIIYNCSSGLFLNPHIHMLICLWYLYLMYVYKDVYTFNIQVGVFFTHVINF